jgi:Phosphoglucose isomerase
MFTLHSFDQWGVELGKKLAGDVRARMHAFRQGRETQGLTGWFNPSTQRLMSRYTTTSVHCLLPELCMFLEAGFSIAQCMAYAL